MVTVIRAEEIRADDVTVVVADGVFILIFPDGKRYSFSQESAEEVAFKILSNIKDDND